VTDHKIAVQTDDENYVDVQIDGDIAVSVDVLTRSDDVSVTLYDQDDPETTDRIGLDWSFEDES